MNQEFRYCPHCGTQNLKEAKECIKCGLIFSKFKPLEITIEKGKKSSSSFLIFLFGFILISFVFYMVLVILLEKKYVGGITSSDQILILVLKLEKIYNHIPANSLEQKEKFLKEIEMMEKILVTFPVSEDIEKINNFEENLKDIKKLLLEDRAPDAEIQRKIESRFNKLK